MFRKYFTLLLLLPFYLSAFSFIDHKETIQTAQNVSLEQYPNADTVLIDQYSQIKYNSDATYIEKSESYYKILTETGRRSFTSISRYFTIPYQTEKDCRIPLIEIIKPNGDIETIDQEKNKQISISSGQMDANIYNPNNKILEINIPHPEIGDIVHFTTYDHITHPQFEKQWSNISIIENTNPIIHTTYEIIGNKKLPLKKIAVRDEIENSLKNIKYDTNKQHYIWEGNNVPQYFPEPSMPNGIEVLQRIVTSSIAEWGDFSSWYWNLAQSHLETDQDIADKVSEITLNIEDRQEKIESLFYWVAQNIRYAGVIAESESPGYEPHDVTMTFKDRMGVCRDKAALLVAMLRLADIEAYPVLIAASYKLDQEVPSPNFNHAIVTAVDENGDYTLMDPTAETTRELLPSYLNGSSYLVTRPEGEGLRTTPFEDVSNNILTCKTSAQVNEAGKFEAKTFINFSGINDNIYRSLFLSMEPNDIEGFLNNNILGSFPGMNLKSWSVLPKELLDTTQELSIELLFEKNQLIEKLGQYSIMAQPLLCIRPCQDSGGFGLANFILKNNMGLEQRKYDLLLSSNCGISENIEISIHKNIASKVLLPQFNNYDSNVIQWKNQITSDDTGDDKYLKLCMQSDYNIRKAEITPKEYLEIKDLLENIEEDQQRLLFLENPQPERAEYEITLLDSKKEYEIHSESEWKETHYIKKRIENYAGKKNHSEISIAYNPEKEKVNIKNITVTSSDGIVSRPHENAINIMDDPSTSQAPRYPQMKVLVINLTGVDIGSIIEYTLEIYHQQEPFFYLQHNFQRDFPVENEVIILRNKSNIEIGHQIDGESIIESAKGDEIQWFSNNIKAHIKEKMEPPRYSTSPTLWLYKNNWKELAKKIQTALMPAIEDNPLCLEKAAQIKLDSTSDIEIIQAIRNNVMRSINTIPLTWRDIDLEALQKADSTLQAGYGHNVDRALLTYLLLKESGLKPTLLLASSWAQLDVLNSIPRDQYCFQYLNKIIVKVEADGETIYLNDSNQYDYIGQTNMKGSSALNIDSGAFETILPSMVGIDDKSEKEYTLELFENGSAELTIEHKLFGKTYGYYNQFFQESSPEEISRYKQNLISSISQSANILDDLEYNFEKYPGKIKLKLYIEHFSLKQQDMLYFSIPETIEELLPIKDGDRKNDIYVNSHINTKVNYKIILPKMFQKVVSLPPQYNYKLPNNGGSLDIFVEQKEYILEIEIKAQISPALYSSSKAQNLKDVNDILSQQIMKTILLKTTENN